MSFSYSSTHSFSVDLAIELESVELALLVGHFQHWIAFNKEFNKNFYEGRTWTYQTRAEIAAYFPYWSKDQVRRYVDKLVEKGILLKGNFNKKDYDNTVWYSFLDEKRFISGKKLRPPLGQKDPRSEEVATPIPESKPETKPKTIQGNVADHEKGLPSSKEKGKTKYPLKKEQQSLFEWLKSQRTNDPKETTDETFIYYIRVYSEQRLRDAMEFIKREREKGVLIGNPGGFLRNVLSGKIVMQNADTDENKAVAESFISIKQWKSATITEKYLKDEVTGDDIYFNMNPQAFCLAIDKLYQKSELYR